MLGAAIADAIALTAGIVGVIIGVAGILGVIFVMSKQRALSESVGLFTAANEELRAQVVQAREERVAERETSRTESENLRLELHKQLADERAECQRSLGELRGALSVITSGMGNDIAAATLEALKSISQQLMTANGLTVGQLADATEGHRVERDVDPADRTTAEQAYVDRLPTEP